MTPYDEALMAGRAVKSRPVSQEEQQPQTTLGAVGNAGMSSLAAAGNLLDLPGSVVRDVATWMPGGTPAQNPFDQMLPWNWFSDKGRVTGREMMRNSGLVGKKDTWGNFVDGLIFESAVDPLTYLSGGGTAAARALSKAGKVNKFANAAGAMPIPTARHSAMIGKDAVPTGMAAKRASTVRDVLESSRRAAEESGDATPYNSLVQNLIDNKFDEKMLDTSLGGVSPLRIMNPLTGNPIQSVDKGINWLGRQLGAKEDVIIDGVLGAKRYPNAPLIDGRGGPAGPNGPGGLSDYMKDVTQSNPEAKKFYTNPKVITEWMKSDLNKDAVEKIAGLADHTPESLKRAIPGLMDHEPAAMHKWASMIKKAYANNAHADKIIDAEMNFKKDPYRWNWLPEGDANPVHPAQELAESDVGRLWRIDKKKEKGLNPASTPEELAARAYPNAKTFSDLPAPPGRGKVSDYLAGTRQIPSSWKPEADSIDLGTFQKKNKLRPGYDEFYKEIMPELEGKIPDAREHLKKSKFSDFLKRLDSGASMDVESLDKPGVFYRKTLSPDKSKVMSELLDEKGAPTGKKQEYPFEEAWKYAPVKEAEAQAAARVTKEMAAKFEKFSDLMTKVKAPMSGITMVARKSQEVAIPEIARLSKELSDMGMDVSKYIPEHLRQTEAPIAKAETGLIQTSKPETGLALPKADDLLQSKPKALTDQTPGTVEIIPPDRVPQKLNQPNQEIVVDSPTTIRTLPDTERIPEPEVPVAKTVENPVVQTPASEIADVPGHNPDIPASPDINWEVIQSHPLSKLLLKDDLEESVAKKIAGGKGKIQVAHEDAAREAIDSIFRDVSANPGKYQNAGQLRNALDTAAQRKLTDKYKSLENRKTSEAPDDFVPVDTDATDPSSALDVEKTSNQKLEEILDATSSRDKEILDAVKKGFAEGKNQAEVAAELGVGPSAVSNAIKRAGKIAKGEDLPPVKSIDQEYDTIGRSQLHDQLKSVSNPKVADAVMELVEARARAAGESSDDYIARKFAKVQSGSAAEAGMKQVGPGRVAKGAVDFLDDGRAIVTAFSKVADASTFVHELGHVFRRDLDEKTLASITDWAGAAKGWTPAAEEKFARGFEEYMRTGKSPTKELTTVFGKFKAWLEDIYKSVKSLGVDVSKEAQAAYDSLFTSKGSDTIKEGPSRLYQTVQSPSTPKDSEEIAQKFVNAIDKTTGFISDSPAGVMFRAFFSRGSMGTTNPTAQKYAKENTDVFLNSVDATREEIAPVSRMFVDEPMLNKNHTREALRGQVESLTKGIPESEVGNYDIPAGDLEKFTKDGVFQVSRKQANTYLERTVNRQHNTRINEIHRYLEMITDEVPEFLGPEWREGLDKLRTAVGTQMQEIRAYAAANKVSPQEAVAKLRSEGMINGLLDSELKAGINSKELVDDFIDTFYPRAKSPETRTGMRESLWKMYDAFFGSKDYLEDTKKGGSMAYNPRIKDFLPTDHSSNKTRKYRDIPGGTSTLNQFSTDETPIKFLYKSPGLETPVEKTVTFSGAMNRVRTIDGKTPESLIDAMVGHMKSYPDIAEQVQKLEGDLAAAADDEAIEAAKQAIKDFDKNLGDVARKVAHLSTDHADMQKSLFTDNVIGTAMNRIEQNKRVVGAAEVLFKTLRDLAEKRDDIELAINQAIDAEGKEIPVGNMAATGNPTIGKFLRGKAGIHVDNASAIVTEMLGAKADEVAQQIKDVMAKKLENGKGFTISNRGSKIRFKPEKDGIRYFDSSVINKGVLLSPEEALAKLDQAKIPDQMIMDSFVISGKQAKQLEKFVKSNVDSEEVGLIRDGIRKYVTLWKSMQTGIFPAFHMRNLGSGTATNLFRGMYDPRYSVIPTEGKEWNPIMRYAAPILNARKAGRGEYFKGMGDIPVIQRMVDGYETLKAAAEAEIEKLGEVVAKGEKRPAREAFEKAVVDAYRDLTSAHGIIGSRQGVAAEQLLDHADSIKDQIPGSQFIRKDGKFNDGFKPAVGSSGLDQVNPLAGRGVLDNENKFLPYRTGEVFGKAAESINRQAPWISYLQQGYDPKVARDMVNLNQVDYTDLSNFEKDYMRLAAPFWSYLRGSTKLAADEFANHPGGATAQVIRAANRARDKDPSTPEHIQETTAIPLGQSADGTKNYITGLGLGFEDPINAFMPLVRGDLQGFVKEGLSRSNPLLKALVEGGTGVSTFQTGPLGARQLRDLDPPVGRTLSNIKDIVMGGRTDNPDPFISPEVEFAVGASPLSRLVSTARTVTDKRKWDNPLYALMNLLSGVKVNQVSPAAQDSVLSGRVAEKIREMGGRTYTRPYFPDAEEASWGSSEKADANALMEILKGIDQRRKERRKATA